LGRNVVPFGKREERKPSQKGSPQITRGPLKLINPCPLNFSQGIKKGIIGARRP